MYLTTVKQTMSTNILFDPLIHVNEVYCIMPSLFTTLGPNMIIHFCFCCVKENIYLLSGSRPGNCGQGSLMVEPARAAGQHNIVSHVALQYDPPEETV